MPLVVNLRVDPFEHCIDAPACPLYAGEKLWAILPAAAILHMFIETFEDFPPRRAAAGFNPATMLAGVYAAAATRQGN